MKMKTKRIIRKFTIRSETIKRERRLKLETTKKLLRKKMGLS